jgi:putative effector of murein hydrolase LrgA (UPF0299 family)
MSIDIKTILEVAKSLGLDIVPIVLVALLTETIKRVFLKDIIKNKLKTMGLFLLPYGVSVLISFVFVILVKQGNCVEYIKNIFINGILATFVYRVIAKFIPEEKQCIDINNLVDFLEARKQIALSKNKGRVKEVIEKVFANIIESIKTSFTIK